MQKKLNKKIEDALRSLDGIEKASPAPFFFTRLEARMEREKSIWEEISSFVTKPLVAFAGLCLIIMINAIVILSSEQKNKSSVDQSNEFATVDEYNQVSSTFYEFVNTKP